MTDTHNQLTRSVVVGKIPSLAHESTNRQMIRKGDDHHTNVLTTPPFFLPWDDAVERRSSIAESLLSGAKGTEVFSSLGNYIAAMPTTSEKRNSFIGHSNNIQLNVPYLRSSMTMRPAAFPPMVISK